MLNKTRFYELFFDLIKQNNWILTSIYTNFSNLRWSLVCCTRCRTQFCCSSKVLVRIITNSSFPSHKFETVISLVVLFPGWIIVSLSTAMDCNGSRPCSQSDFLAHMSRRNACSCPHTNTQWFFSRRLISPE